MIQIGTTVADPSALKREIGVNPVQADMIDILAQSPLVHSYDSLDQLKFELTLRYNTVAAAEALGISGANFGTYEHSQANPAYWILTHDGGFQLRPDVKPSDAIKDIFHNGSIYFFECSMAMVLVYYGAVLKSIGDDNFDRLFRDLYIHDWQHDQDLGLTTYNYDQREFLPGDVLYFKNPDFNPRTPEWQGENVVAMGRGYFFGHGVGILSAHEMISFLNRQRRPFSFRSAYLLDQATRPDFKYLSRFSMGFMRRLRRYEEEGHRLITAFIGRRTYLEA